MVSNAVYGGIFKLKTMVVKRKSWVLYTVLGITLSSNWNRHLGMVCAMPLYSKDRRVYCYGKEFREMLNKYKWL